jgi:thiol-disulfide isomerase/thioredoxin
VLAGLRAGVPSVVYFWSETCAPCKTVQLPALKQLQVELGPDGLQVLAIDALAQSQVADEWGVLGVPTTFIIDRNGQARRVNHGVVRADQLRQQIEALD